MRELYIVQNGRLDCRSLFHGLTALGKEKGRNTDISAETESPEEKDRLDFYQADSRINIWDQEPETKARVARIIEHYWKISGKDKKEKILGMTGGRDSLQLLMEITSALGTLGLEGIRVSCLTEGIRGEGASEEILEAVRCFRLPVAFSSEKGSCLSLAALCLLGDFYRGGTPEGPVYVEGAAVVKDPGGEGWMKAMILADSKPEVAQDQEQEKKDWVQVLETNVDDCSGEQLGYAIERLMEAGALDASCFPIYMKKGRPAYMLQVICRKEKQEALEDIIFCETTSIGLRRYQEERRILARTFERVKLEDGHVIQIKVCSHHGQKFYYPEYGDVKKVCQDTGRSYRSVYDQASALAAGMFAPPSQR